MEDKTMTNKERIQKMTEEELAHFLVNLTECNKNCVAIEFCTIPDTPCEVFFLKWLNNED